jgi:hypothetical protein
MARFHLARLILLLSVGSLGADSSPTTGVVSVNQLDVHNEPRDTGYVTGRLTKGTEVIVRRIRPDGWLAIDPPPESFRWIDQDALVLQDADRAEVGVDEATVRAGRPLARMPGPPRLRLKRGALVRLLDRPSLTLQHGDRVQVWRAIEPPEGDLCYVAAYGVALTSMPKSVRPVTPTQAQVRSFDTGVVSLGPEARADSLEPGFAADLKRVESMHRSALRQPLESWSLAGVREAYEELLKKHPVAKSREIVQARLARLEKQVAVAKSARAFQDRLTKTRALDKDVSDVMRRRDAQRASGLVAYDAEGMLQASSKEVDGVKVFTLVGSDGETSAYVSLPPGLAAKPYLSRYVGVRGDVRYEESLGAKVVHVTEMEALSDAP